MTTPRRVRSHAEISLSLFGKQQIQTLHAASLKILDRTGVAVHDAAALDLLKKAGARVEGDRVRMKAVLVERALKTAPKSIQIHDRAGKPAMRLEGWNSYYGTGSDCPSALDADTGLHRPSTKADVGRLALLCDRLANIDFCMSMGIASDASRVTSFVHQFDAMVRNTSKPVLFTAHDAEDMRDILSLAEIATGGGRRDLEERPRYVHYNEPVSPLHHTPNGTGKLLFCAEHRLPMIYIASPMMGAIGPGDHGRLRRPGERRGALRAGDPSVEEPRRAVHLRGGCLHHGHAHHDLLLRSAGTPDDEHRLRGPGPSLPSCPSSASRARRIPRCSTPRPARRWPLPSWSAP